MKIGIVTAWSERGAAYVSKQFMTTLEKKHEVFIFARGGEKYEIGNKDWDLPNVFWSKKAKSHYSTALNIRELEKWIKKNNIQILIFNEQRDWEPVIKAKEMGIPVGSYIDYYTEETIPLFDSYDFLICNTKRHYEAFQWHPMAFYIPWGTDIELFKPKSNTGLPEKKDSIVFFHSNGMSPSRKGTNHVLKSFYKLKDSKAELVIHTQVDLREFYNQDKEINMMIIELEKLGKLKIINKTITAPGLYYLGDVYLYPSKLDGLGLTIAEALASGLPVITTDSAPMNEIIEPGYNGNLVKVKKFFSRSDGYYWPQAEVDDESLVNEMSKYIENIECIHDYKKTSRKYAEKKLDWTKNSLELLEIIEQVDSHPVKKKTKLRIKKYQLKHLPFRSIPFLEEMHYYFISFYKKRF